MAGVQGRGVLLDLEGRYGREPGVVGYDDLMATMRAQGTQIEQGDFLCLYTGFADLISQYEEKA